jgi:hypothetical protein
MLVLTGVLGQREPNNIRKTNSKLLRDSLALLALRVTKPDRCRVLYSFW